MAALSARSIVASVLLGTLPPRLPGRLLVAFAEEFDVKPGATRVALSRMVERGELVREDDGHYRLTGPLLDRQERQEAGLAPAVREWSGDWEMYVVRGGARGSVDRAALRRAGQYLGLGERRDGVWLRPDNLDPQRLPGARAVVDSQADRFVARPDHAATDLAAELFDLAGWSAIAEGLVEEMESVESSLAAQRPGALAAGFEVAARTLRHLVADPLLPETLGPADWPAAALRHRYARYDQEYRSHLSAFFRSRSRLAG